MGLVLVFALVAVAVAGYGYLTTQRVRSAWRTAAHDLGLLYTEGSWMKGPSIEGSIAGFRIEVDVETRGGGDDREKFTRVRVSYPPAPLHIRLTKQGTLSFVKRLFGGTDLLIGDPGFDSRVVIESDHEVTTSQFLSPARRMAVLAIFEGYHKAEVTERSMQVERRGMMSTSTEVVSTIRLLLDKAIIMSAPTEVDMALETQAQGDLREAADQLREINAANATHDAPNSFTQLLEAEALVSLGDGATAHEVLAAIEVGPDREVDGWKGVAAANLQPIAPSPVQDSVSSDVVVSDEASSAEPASAAATVDLSSTSVIDDLFAANRMGFETEQHFLDTYAGRTVHWSGEIEKIRAFQTDLDFAGSGMKATVLLGNLGDGRLVSRRVHAIVQLPEDMDVKRGQSITFTGALLRLDRYMRNMFVANATLE